MSDIAMCRGTGCPKKDTCYRYTAPVNLYRQSYFIVVPINIKTGICEEYWNNKDRK